MTSAVSSDSNPLVAVAARRTESLDTQDISELATEETKQIFGRVNVVQLLEKANLAVTLLDDSNIIIGHASFADFPSLQNVSQCDWEFWFAERYSLKFTALNTLFLKYFVSKPDFKQGSLKEILRTVFSAIPFLHFIIITVPDDLDLSEVYGDVFTLVPENDGVEKGTDKINAYFCERGDYCPMLHIRGARVEDFDDLMPIFDRHNNQLREIYGDFFLSELIEAQTETDKAFVADVNGTAVGFISITTNFNTNILDECFELAPFNGLNSYRTAEAAGSGPRSQSGNEQRSESTLSKSPVPAVSAASPSSERQRTFKSPIKDGKVSAKRISGASEQNERTTFQSPGSRASTAIPSPEPEQQSQTESPTSRQRVMQPTAMSIQLFCIDERYEMRSVDFILAVFESFPHKDFAVITIPHTVPEFPLLQVFKRVTPKSGSILSQELYVFHRFGLLSNFTVRHCRSEDQASINKLLDELHAKQDMLKDVSQYNKARRDSDGTAIQAFVAECNSQIVGVCVLRQEEEIEYIRAHFNIEDFVYFNQHERTEHSKLFHFVLNPIFSHYGRHFLKEILRLSKKSCLYFSLPPPFSSNALKKPNSVVTCLPDLIPIKARRQIIYQEEDLGINAPSERILRKKEAFALYHFNRKLTFEPKVVVNVRIVVVGGSDTSFSCLETLVFCPHLRFNNLTLITPEPLPDTLLPDDRRHRFVPSSLCFTSEQFGTMGLNTWIHVVTGKVVKLDRKKKIVITNDGRKVPYDHLLLCTGQQFQLPVPTNVDVAELVTTQEALKKKLPQNHSGFVPRNVFLVNLPTSCKDAAEWVTDEASKVDGTAVIYGATLEAYVWIQSMISLGYPGHRIAFVKPPESGKLCFNNPKVQERVEKALEKLGVVEYTSYTLAQWNDGQDNEPYLFCASFTSDTKPLRILCKAFFCFQERKVDFSIFKAINDSCLVYDGKLVIDSCFRTNDPFIKAAGPMTKYARRYHADQWSHANFNSKEIGAKLAESVLQMFDPTLEGEVRHDPLDDKLIPVFDAPKAVSCILPGGYNYLHIYKPSLPIPMESLMSKPDSGTELVTDTSTAEAANYFRLHVNQYNFVETITCLRTEVIDVSNLLALYGIHARYLNNLVSRYDEGLIRDFFRFFQEPWCMAIYHDRFQDFRTEVRELLATKTDSNLSLEEKVNKLVEEDLNLTDTQRQYLMDSFVGSGTKQAVEERLLSFLHYNEYHLPMYAKPWMTWKTLRPCTM